jgi:hypothetical protein
MPKFKVPNFGPDGRPERFNASTASLNQSTVSPVLPLAHPGDIGVVYEEGTKRWQIYELVDAAMVAAGDVEYIKNYAGYTATPTIGNSSQNEVAGIAELASATPSATNRVCVALRIGGTINVKSADATINARGLEVISDTSTNRVILQIAAGSLVEPIGVSQAAQGGGFVSVFLRIKPI